ncbi:DUF1972 domain-containing protein [Pseudomonas citronellolis]|uniref:DUF1972 domain-containing protein n=1 Tax=Pseudomonas TaxID=286 RepID=UPI000E2F67BD|nr:DUF1972 domain-containing protein [Pseudomonas citronellolis]MCP1602163.1 glycosyltransferase involved in cell wall biosynthesis [Pseudomonas citronellolis]MCP1653114.1 glycosyltransferase involved in cell wall biosynthesis [Pseudomonas citronellolis]MCP1720059.1 glycosyltransferase involved in cell wall biosynthesis [Pseudomonas citronellolis]
MKEIYILGTRGIPAEHGGFETFAEHLSIFLSKRGWKVHVYCQKNSSADIYVDQWQDVYRINVPVNGDGTLSTIIFDWKATRDAMKRNGIFLTLGYNTAIFNILQRIKGQTNLINMDGIEWHRAKWGRIAKAWFWLNEKIGCYAGNHLIADHPNIKAHLSRTVPDNKITMIPYGAELISASDETAISHYGVSARNYSIIIARAEPENSILEIVKAFSRERRNHKLLVLGNYSTSNPYHCMVQNAASDEVLFLGAIYTPTIVKALRYFSRFYIHGHTVGGTNPSLVEALGAGNAVIAHDNPFNRWVAGEGAMFFKTEDDCAKIFDNLLPDIKASFCMGEFSKSQFLLRFTWEQVLQDYEKLLNSWYPQ